MATLCLKQTTSYEVFFSPKAEVFVCVLNGHTGIIEKDKIMLMVQIGIMVHSIRQFPNTHSWCYTLLFTRKVTEVDRDVKNDSYCYYCLLLTASWSLFIFQLLSNLRVMALWILNDHQRLYVIPGSLAVRKYPQLPHSVFSLEKGKELQLQWTLLSEATSVDGIVKWLN